MKSNKFIEIMPILLFIILAILNLADTYLLIPKYSLVIADLHLDLVFGDLAETAMGFVTASTTFISGISMIFWGYYADRIKRKYALFFSSIVWSFFSFLTFLPIYNYFYLLVVRSLTGIGLGCVLPIGFSILSDYIHPEKRALAFAWWGIAVGAGSGIGYLITTISSDWHVPFLIVSIPGFIFTFLFLFIQEPKRAKKEHEFEKLIEEGHVYSYRIELQDLKRAWTQKTNRWVILQGIFGVVPWGLLSVWLPYYFSQRFFFHGGIGDDVAATVGALLGGLFMIGGIIGNIVFGFLGDRWKNPKARIWLCIISVFGGIPLLLIGVVFPFPIITTIPNDPNIVSVILALVNEISYNPTLLGIFIMALIGSAIAGGTAPNWYAVTADINLPEHRGSIMSISTMTDTIGRGIGPVLGGFFIGTFSFLAFPLDINMALLIGVLFWVPCGTLFTVASITYVKDKNKIHEILRERAKQVRKEKNS